MQTATRIFDHNIHLASYRRKLAPRPKDPYKKLLGSARSGQWIGFLKTDANTESWCACWRDSDGKGRQQQVGNAALMPYEEAVKLARDVLANAGMGIRRDATVKQACAAYLEHFTAQRSNRGSHGKRAININAWKVNHYILSRPLAAIPLQKLRIHDLNEWRKSLLTNTCNESTVNRVTRVLKAVLNFALDQQMVGTDDAWKRFKAYPGADRAREVFMTAAQRKNFLNVCTPAMRDLCTGLFYTAARAGELRLAKVSDLDRNRWTLRLVHYKGRQGTGAKIRFLPLNMFDKDVRDFLERMTKDKDGNDKPPSDYLFTRASGLSWNETDNGSNYFNTRFNYYRVKARKLPKLTKDKKEWTKEELEEAEQRFPAEAVPYSFRHTAISEWLSAGLLPSDVAECAGTSIVQIDKHYRKFIPNTVVGKLANVKV